MESGRTEGKISNSAENYTAPIAWKTAWKTEKVLKFPLFLLSVIPTEGFDVNIIKSRS
jgi:hypothetical protein